jgi:hypothetical protein
MLFVMLEGASGSSQKRSTIVISNHPQNFAHGSYMQWALGVRMPAVQLLVENRREELRETWLGSSVLASFDELDAR